MIHPSAAEVAHALDGGLAQNMLSKYIMRANWLSLLMLTGLPALAADSCNPADLVGPYAFQLTGLTDISGTPKPTVGLGRIIFDGRGILSGTVSVTFAGLLLGNPVTGAYGSLRSILAGRRDTGGDSQEIPQHRARQLGSCRRY